MPLTGKALELAQTMKLSEKAQEWLCEQGCADHEKIALAVSTESEVVENIAKPMLAKQAILDTLGARAEVKLFWFACREAYEKDKKETAGTGSQDAEAKIPPKESLRIVDLWWRRHGYVIPDSQLLVESIKDKMWGDFTSEPPQMRIWLAEEMRTRACLNKKVGHSMALVNGKTLETVEIIADAVDRAFELFSRIRAFFITLAYVSISTPTWFPLQAAMQVIDKVFQFIHASYNGRMPPVDFLVNAWAHSCHQFCERIRIEKCTAEVAITNYSAWEGKWAWTPAMAITDGTTTGVASSGSASYPDADNKALMNQIKSMAGQVKRLQSASQVADRRRQQSPNRAPIKRTGYFQSQGGKFARRPRGEEFEEYKGKGGGGGGGGGGGHGGGGGGKGRGNAAKKKRGKWY